MHALPRHHAVSAEAIYAPDSGAASIRFERAACEIRDIRWRCRRLYFTYHITMPSLHLALCAKSYMPPRRRRYCPAQEIPFDIRLIMRSSRCSATVTASGVLLRDMIKSAAMSREW